MTDRQYGPFPYSPIIERPRLKLPNGARLALWVSPQIEFFPLDKPMPGEALERPRGQEHTPMVREWAQRDYGNRVGIFRLMDVLGRHGIRGTAGLNSDVCKMHPQIVKKMVELNWEILAHCRRNTERLSEINPEDERALIDEVLDTITTLTGTRPRGWLGAGLTETWNTLGHLTDAGIEYTADWVNDDLPYVMTVNGKEIVSLPYTYELNDNAAIMRAKHTPGEFERMIKDQFDVLYEEGDCVMAIGVHPHVSGMPHRIRALDRALTYIDSFPNVWKATGSEIVENFRANLVPA
jgi:allantoinase